MPGDKKKRFMAEYDLSPEICDVLLADKHLADYSEEVISELRAWIEAGGDSWERQKKKLSKAAADWLTSKLLKYLNEHKLSVKKLKITPENFAELITLVYEGKVNSTTAQQILDIMFEKGGDPTNIMDSLGLKQIDDAAELEKVIKKILTDNPGQVEEYKGGKEAVFKFFIGQTMSATQGKANPKTVAELLKKLLT